MAAGLGLAALGGLETALGLAYTATVVGFGSLWVLVNLYQYYPFVRAFAGRLRRRVRASPTATAGTPAPDGRGLPRIDVLLAAYDEAEVIGDAIRSVREAAYPEDRLELHLLVEPDDGATREALATLRGAYAFTVHVIPEAYPGEPNKPRALDYGFTVTDGDVVGVLDAEDVVQPGLFREVAAALDDGGADYALGHLDMANEDDGWLNLLFRAEYGFWYDLVVPAFVAAGYPVPLGGTTCFFRRPVLESAGIARTRRDGSPWHIAEQLWLAERDLLAPVPWDPHHVTEDFELGLLLWEEGFSFRYLDAVTAEESPVTLDGWLDQRVRWQSGKLLTLGKYLGRPPDTWRERLHVGWQSMLPHLGPVNVLGIGLVFWLALVVGAVPPPLLGWLLGLGLGFLVLSAGLFAAGYWAVSDRPPRTRLRRACVVALSALPYWLLQWFADARALVDIHRGRVSWTPSTHLGRHAATRRIAAAAFVQRPSRAAPLAGRQVVVGLLGVLALGLALRGVVLDRWSLWHDEIYTLAVRGGAPVADLVAMTSDPHPPLYYLVVHGWMAVAGSSPTAARSLSVAFSVATVAGVFWLGRTVFDDRTGLLAALLVAVSTTHVHLGRTVRMYSLFTLLAVLSWTLYAQLRTDGRCFEWLPRRWLPRTVAYVAVTVALLYTHVYGLVVVASQFLARWLSASGRVDRRVWWLAQGLVALAFLPWSVVVGRQLLRFSGADGTSPIAWIPPPSLGLVRETVLLVGGYPRFYPIDAGSPLALAVVGVMLFAATVALVFTFVGYEPRDGGRYYLVGDRGTAMLAVFVAAMALPLAFSYLVVPVFVPRYAIVAGLPLAVLTARGLRHVPDVRWRGALLAVLVVGSLVTTGLYYASDSQEDWRGVAGHLAEEAAPADLVVVQPTWLVEGVDYYAPGLAADRYALRPDDHLAPADLERLRRLASAHRTVWLVRHEATDSDAARSVLRRSHREVAVVDGGVVTLHRFERRR